MANIKVSELHPAGFALFQDSESFLNDLSDTDSRSVQGGEGGNGYESYQFHGFAQALIVGFAIHHLSDLVSHFSYEK